MIINLCVFIPQWTEIALYAGDFSKSLLIIHHDRLSKLGYNEVSIPFLFCLFSFLFPPLVGVGSAIYVISE